MFEYLAKPTLAFLDMLLGELLPDTTAKKSKEKDKEKDAPLKQKEISRKILIFCKRATYASHSLLFRRK
jgi:hypothetical protein